MRAFPHHLTELTGQDQFARAGNARCFDEQDIAADRRPGEAGGNARHACAHRSLALELWRAEDGRKIFPRDADGPALSFGKAHGGMAQRLADLTLQAPYARFAGIVLDDIADRFVRDVDLVRLEPVCLHLPSYQIAVGDLELLVGGVAGEADDLHAVAQRAGNSVEHIRRGDEDHPAQVEWNGQVVVAERIVLFGIEHFHFGVLCWFLFFIFVHVTLVFITGARQNLNYMWAGVNDNSWNGLLIWGCAMVVVVVTWWLASPFTISHARLVQKIGQTVVGPLMAIGEWGNPRTQYTGPEISSYLWPNGTLPNSEEFDSFVKSDFADYRLRVSGLVENPKTFSYAELKAMPKQEQITEHFCIQGWSGVAKWGGVPMRHILDIVKPTADARYAVFYSLSEGSAGGGYYDVHKMQNMGHELTILAYEMNGAPLSVLHGAPLRLRCENELGFKMVKWIAAIEFVNDFAHLGAGEGGYNEDHEFYGYRMPI